MKNLKQLTITILNYNRIHNLSKVIYQIYPTVKKFGIHLTIIDDYSYTDFSQEMKYFKKDYKKFSFIRNKKNFGHDQNYIKAIKNCKTDYIWIISNSTILPTDKFKLINELLDGRDILIFKTKNRSIKSKNNLNKNKFLEKFSWHICLTGSTILSKKIFKNYQNIDFKKFKNFPHIGLILSNVSQKKINYFYSEKLLISSFNKKSYWVKKAFEVFLLDWSKAILNLNGYSLESKLNAIKEHDKNVGLFNFRSLVALRSENNLKFKDILIYHKYIKNYSNLNFPIAVILTLIPHNFIRLLIKFYKTYVKVYYEQN